MAENGCEIELSRLSILLNAIRSGLFRVIASGDSISTIYPGAVSDINQVAVIMRGFDRLPVAKFPHINGVLDGKELPEDMELIYAELKDMFTDASSVIACGN